jgi:hypothetical protein
MIRIFQHGDHAVIAEIFTSTSEIATVPGAAVSAVLMLVELVSWFCEPQQRGEALAERPAEEGLEGQEPRGTRRVED